MFIYEDSPCHALGFDENKPVAVYNQMIDLEGFFSLRLDFEANVVDNKHFGVVSKSAPQVVRHLQFRLCSRAREIVTIHMLRDISIFDDHALHCSVSESRGKVPDTGWY